MKEFNTYIAPLPDAAPEPPKRRYRETPRWRVAQARTDNKMLQWQNEAVERHYHEVIKTVKALLIAQGGDTIFEQDHKNNPESFTFMHTFVTSSFYWRLDCLLAYNYEVFYAFHNCPYEAEVRTLMQPYPLDRTTHLPGFLQDFEAFYKRLLLVSDPVHLTTLKAQG